MKPHYHLSLIATTLVITLPHYSAAKESNHLFARVNKTDAPPHQGCLHLIDDREPPHTKLVGEEFERTRTSDYKVEREVGATAAQCRNGLAGGYPCNNVDLLSMLDIATLDGAIGGSNAANDIWGWTDSSSGREFALIGILQGTAFVEITDPVNPIYVGGLPTATDGSLWRDVKTFGNFAFIVSEAANHGMQIFNLENLLTATPGTSFSESARYKNFGNAHNIFINEDTGYAYAVGSNSCSGGLHMMDINNSSNPVFAGCYSDDGYTHDVQCVTYDGPDSAYENNEICFCSNEDTITVVDVTIKTSPIELSRKSYDNDHYTHQGWLTEDHSHFIFNDELDEIRGVGNTATHVMDVADLKNIKYLGKYSGRTSAIDHNNYVKGDYLYQANYRAGLNVLRIVDVSNRQFEEAGYFDVYPDSDSNNFNGAWSNYPYFPSGNIVVSGIEQGLFVLKFNDDGSTPASTLSPAPTSAPTTCNGIELTVDLTTDSYASETGWTVKNDSGNGSVVMSNTALSPGETYTTSKCLPNDCYVFEITDSFGDGICCGYGSGSFSVTLDGAIISSGSEFGSSASVNFCANTTKAPSAPTASPSTSPNVPPSTPSASPSTPSASPSTPSASPSTPSASPSTPSASPSTPSASPTASPTASPSTSPTETPVVTPTATPIVEPTGEPVDNPKWSIVKGNGKVADCGYVAGKKAEKRCKKVGSIGDEEVKACDACRAACSEYPCVDPPSCNGDDSDWKHTKQNGKKKGCDWVAARSTKKRCKNKVGLVDNKEVRACEGCCDSCSDHPC